MTKKSINMPRTQEQTDQIKEERKDEIVRKSLYLFALNGFGAVKIDDITNASKISHGLFYHYFKTKDAVFHSVMGYCHSLMEDVWESINLEQEPKYLIHDIINIIFSRLKDKNTDFACTLYLILSFYIRQEKLPRPPKLDKPKHKRLYDYLIESISKGQEQGEFNEGNPQEYTIAILAMVKDLSFSRILLGPKKFICPDSQIVMNMLLKQTA